MSNAATHGTGIARVTVTNNGNLIKGMLVHPFNTQLKLYAFGHYYTTPTSAMVGSVTRVYGQLSTTFCPISNFLLIPGCQPGLSQNIGGI